MRTDINIYEATEATPELANAIAALLPQLSATPHPFGLDDLKAIASSKTAISSSSLSTARQPV